MKHCLFLFLAPAFILVNSCKKYAPAPAAFFIQSSTVTVAPSSSTLQGSASHKITDLFLYVDGQFQGAYKTGNTMPIVNRGQKVHIDVFAGIKNNGIDETTITWLLYEKIGFDTLVESGKTIDRPLAFKYNPNVKFPWLEDFDGMSVSLVRSSQTSTNTVLSVAPGFEGKSASFACAPEIFAQFESAIDYSLPAGNSNVYLELNYKCNCPVEIGVLTSLGERKVVMTLNPKEEWNKIYIQLADAVNRAPNSSKHKVYFRILKTNDFPDPRVWLDNIKLIYL
jgi:hypothetical protein